MKQNPIVERSTLKPSDVKDDVGNLDQDSLQSRIPLLEKENRILKKKLTRAQINLTQIQTSRQQTEELLRSSIQELQESRQVLEAREKDLKDALLDVQSIQGQLMMAEKMSSLGVLVAGVAHEINNPVGFISGNLDYVERYTQSLLHLVELYEKHHQDVNPEIDAWCTEIDLDFIQDDFPRIVRSMQMGSTRIKEIVLSLRTFSRQDEAECKIVDIHDGIDSTLVILAHRMKAEGGRPAIDIIREYGTIPLVECYAGQLNQVFMNILGNAIDAIEDVWDCPEFDPLTTPRARSITVQTCLIEPLNLDQSTPQWLRISITDSGNGMSEQVRSRIFDPFFTTKSIGKGTGMGLSISYQIIADKHNGRLDCFSVEGFGTEFVLTIPIRQTAARPEMSAPKLSGYPLRVVN